MCIDLGRQGIFIQQVLCIQLHLLKGHECFVVVQWPPPGVGGLSGLLLYAIAPEDCFDRIFGKPDAELFLKIPGKPTVPKPCPFALLYNQLLKVACCLCR